MVVTVSQNPALVAYVSGSDVLSSDVWATVAYAPHEAQYADASQLYIMAPYAVDQHTTPEASVLYTLVTYTAGIPDSARSRAWTFVLDGHTFYVLDLGTEGTFLYDISTQQWCQFTTDGHNGWNLKNGIRWGTVGRVLGGDESGGYVWELDPTLGMDENFRDIVHMVSANIDTRSRVFHAVESIRINGTPGHLTDTSGGSFSMSFSDDGGNTYVGPFTVDLTEGNFSGEIAFTSLGSFMAPGRVFQFSDVGGLESIDGADVFVEDFDDNELIMKNYYEKMKRGLSRGE